MSADNQERFNVEIDICAEMRRKWPDHQKRIISLSGYAAAAFRKLLEAGPFGVHVREIRRDALARFDQKGIAYRCFANERRGTGRDLAWVRLEYDDRQFVAIVPAVTT